MSFRFQSCSSPPARPRPNDEAPRLFEASAFARVDRTTAGTQAGGLRKVRPQGRNPELLCTSRGPRTFHLGRLLTSPGVIHALADAALSRDGAGGSGADPPGHEGKRQVGFGCGGQEAVGSWGARGVGQGMGTGNGARDRVSVGGAFGSVCLSFRLACSFVPLASGCSGSCRDTQISCRVWSTTRVGAPGEVGVS